MSSDVSESRSQSLSHEHGPNQSLNPSLHQNNSLADPRTAAADWRRLDSVVVLATPWFDVRQDAVIRPDGAADVYHHVATPGSVTVLPVAEDERVLLTRQWIYTHGGVQWRLPAGTIEPRDERPVAAARRELAEETGLRAARWAALGAVNGADSLTNHVDHVFLARDLTQGESALEGGEADLAVSWVPFEQALELVWSGQIRHAGSAYALLSFASFASRSSDSRCSMAFWHNSRIISGGIA